MAAVLKLVLGRCLHRKIARFLTPQDTIHVTGCAPVLIHSIGTIGNQAAGGGVKAFVVRGGQLVAGGQFNDQIVILNCPAAPRKDHAAIRSICECCDRAFDFLPVAHVDRFNLHAERRRNGLNGGELAEPGWGGWIPNHRSARHAGGDAFKQFEPFSSQAVFVQKESRGIAARPRQTVDEAGIRPGLCV